jgi:hypothetical protein
MPMRRKFRASRERPATEYYRIGGKPAARVIFWVDGRKVLPSGHPQCVIPTRRITNPKQVPKSAIRVALVLFDTKGNPLRDMVVIPRSQLENYRLVS